MLCQETLASPELREFVRGFLSKNIRALRPVGGETLMVARHCLSDFNRHLAHVSKEDGGEGENEDMIHISDRLIDHSTRKVKVKEKATLMDVGDALAAQIRLHRI